MLKDTVENYAQKQPARFHMPGHKGVLSAYDITELSFSDNLHAPTGDILRLEKNIASIYGAKDAFLLVNGSTAGNCAFFLALTRTLGRAVNVLVARDCHKSVLSGAILSGAKVCGVNIDLCGVVTAEEIERCILASSEKIDAVCITSPNYYGMCADTEKIYAVTQKYGALLYTDSAHGAHFPFSKHLPNSPAMHCDACCVSTHKTLCAMNQTGVLFRNDCAITISDMQEALALCQTTSPSYPLMLSIENSVSESEQKLWDAHCVFISEFCRKLSSLGIMFKKRIESEQHTDMTRICISHEGLAESGFALSQYLETQNIYVEMADADCIVLITSPHDLPEWYTMLMSALSAAKSSYSGKSVPHVCAPILKSSDIKLLDVKRAFFAKSAFIPLSSAIGRISKKPVGIYPPGVAVVFPSEMITASVVEYLLEAAKLGAALFGINSNNEIEVICDE